MITESIDTYLLQQRIVKGMLAVCSYCHKIRIREDIWKELEMFTHDYSKIAITHSICPDCYKQEIENVREANADAAP